MKNSKVGDSNLVCHSISHYITILQNRLNNAETITITSDEYDNNLFKTLWTNEEIEIVDNLFRLAVDKKKKSEEYTYAINAIEAVLQEKDDTVQKIVNKISTSI